MNAIGRWRASRRRRIRRRRHADDAAAGARARERDERIALITPIDVVCTPESWARILALTTFRVPDSNWTVAPFRDHVERPRGDGLVAVELDAEAFLRLLLDMRVDEDMARYRYSGSDAAFVRRVYRQLAARVDAVDPRRPERSRVPARPVFLDDPPQPGSP